MIKFYYGMSGTFKTTTINYDIAQFDKGLSSIEAMFSKKAYVESSIKRWKSFENAFFPGMIERNNLNFGILHLMNLRSMTREFLERGKYVDDLDFIQVERGISDMIFYQIQKEPDLIKDGDEWKIIHAVDGERQLLPNQPYDGPYDYSTIEKLLLIQKDRNFIETKVLSEPSRKEVFPDVDSYLKAQDQYVEFTKKYNNITKVIEINNAEEYLNSLKDE